MEKEKKFLLLSLNEVQEEKGTSDRLFSAFDRSYVLGALPPLSLRMISIV